MLAQHQLTQLMHSLVDDLGSVRSDHQLQTHPKFAHYAHTLGRLFSSYELFFPQQSRPLAAVHREGLRLAAWNIERGMALPRVIDALLHHPVLKSCDVWLITEADYGMARSGNVYVAQALAQALDCHGVFAPAYINFDLGHGGEKKILRGNNQQGLQGHAILSRFPLDNINVVTLPNAKDHLASQERQIGNEVAILADVQTPYGPMTVAPIHLEAHSSRRHRQQQMQAALTALNQRHSPTLIGGDWNTTTYNADRPYRAILGFWRRVLMGIQHTINNHYPYPDRYFEKPLFELIHKHGFATDPFNVPGGCTLHYDFNDIFVRQSLEDWVPQWCFPFMDWALRSSQGRCSFKLDWLAGRGLRASNPFIIQDLPTGLDRCSDHDPVVVNVLPS